MSFLDRIRAANEHDPGLFRPFLVAGQRVGRVRHDFATTLERWPGVFDVDAARVTLAGDLDGEGTSSDARTAAVREVLRALLDEGLILGWRDELYPVTRSWGEPARLLMERAAVPYFGVRGFGVHLNGFVRGRDGLRMWVARRSMTKPTSPGKLDQLAAGGQPAGIGLKRNLVKECAEEAGIPKSLAEQAKAVGAVTYALGTPVGFRPDVLFVFDLELPADFTPVNTDGEVADFYLWPMDRVLDVLRETDQFKFNCALVAIDFAVRHGFIPPDQPDYVEISHGLRGGAALDDW